MKFMTELIVKITGHSMWPTLEDGQIVAFQPVDGMRLSVGQIVLLPSPFDKREMIVKRISEINKNEIFVVGDNPDPTSSSDSHNFGWVAKSTVAAVQK